MCDLMDCKNCVHSCKDYVSDRDVEVLWQEFMKLYQYGIPPVLHIAWQGFKVGTRSNEVLDWFDSHYSRGIIALRTEYPPF